jgi:hypothetical protein
MSQYSQELEDSILQVEADTNIDLVPSGAMPGSSRAVERCACFAFYLSEIAEKGFPYQSANRINECAFGASGVGVFTETAFLGASFRCLRGFTTAL